MKLASWVGLGAATVGFGAMLPACSDPVAPLPQGAVSFSVLSGGQCLPGPSNSNIPPVVGKPAVTATEKNGEVQGNGASVDRCGESPICCRVSGGGPFNVQATFTSGRDSITISATVADGQTDGKGTVSLVNDSLKTGYSSPSDRPCTFSIAAGNVAAGRAWGTFDCEAVTDPSTAGGSSCQARGSFVLENCEQ
jgi:hypothetical protein